MIIPVHAANPSAMTGGGNWTFALPGKVPALIDAGVGKGEHLDAIAQQLPDGPSIVLVTHGHSDHIAGAPTIAARWPRAKWFKYPRPSHDARIEVPWNPLHDKQRIEAGDTSLEVVYTPGHAVDHVCFWHQPSRTMVCGDLVVQGSTVVIPAGDGGSLLHYLESLRRILSFHPARLMPAHGPEILDPVAIVEQYLEHRQKREEQVLAALQDGASSIESITARIYPGLLPALVPMAHQSVLAHLEKLRNEGRASNDGTIWTLTR